MELGLKKYGVLVLKKGKTKCISDVVKKQTNLRKTDLDLKNPSCALRFRDIQTEKFDERAEELEICDIQGS